MSFYAPIACQSARPINLLIARLALALCTQGHSGWARDFERPSRLILEIDIGELLPVSVAYDVVVRLDLGGPWWRGSGARSLVRVVISDRQPEGS